MLIVAPFAGAVAYWATPAIIAVCVEALQRFL